MCIFINMLLIGSKPVAYKYILACGMWYLHIIYSTYRDIWSSTNTYNTNAYYLPAMVNEVWDKRYNYKIKYIT